MDDVIFGFRMADIHELAETLTRVLEIRLYPYRSPLIGPWYDSENLNRLIAAARKGTPPEARKEAPDSTNQGRPYHLELTLNNHDGIAPTFPGGGHCLLRVHGAGPAELQGIERKLRASGLRFKRLNR